jgi:predicted LPLAT superfamily acyltransferase
MKLIYVMHLGSLEVLRSVARITKDVEWRRKRGSQWPHEMRKE